MVSLGICLGKNFLCKAWPRSGQKFFCLFFCRNLSIHFVLTKCKYMYYNDISNREKEDDQMKENKRSAKKINTMEANGYIINVYARPWRFQGSREVYAATITSPAGYPKGSTRWSRALASTVQRAYEIAYE